jgi:glutamate transport system substrate-binding protein
MADSNGGDSNGGGRRPVPLSRRPWRRPAQGTVEDIAARDIAAEELAEVAPPIPEPTVIEEPPVSRFSLAPYRLAGLGLALVLTLALTLVKLFVASPPSVDDLRTQAGVDGWTELTIGVKADQPGVAFYDPATKMWSGFDIDVAHMIAEDLGFRRDEVKFFQIESEDRARMQATDLSPEEHRVPVKMVIASYSITDDRKKMAGVRFSSAYLYTEQSVITLEGHSPVSALEDLRGKRVCTLSASTSESAPDRAGAIVIRKNRVGECFEALDRGDVEAVTTDAAILAGYKAKYPKKYHHWDLGLDRTEAWGVNVGDNPALQKLVDLTLYRSYQDPRDARWEEAYARNLQAETAANDPTPIAVAQQPVVQRPDVRQLPWETTTP